MSKFPGESVSVYFKARRAHDNELVDPSEFDIDVRDPSGSTRINYNPSLLYNLGTGLYRYYFKIPDDVLPGRWYVDIYATVGVYTTFKRIYFEVSE